MVRFTNTMNSVDFAVKNNALIFDQAQGMLFQFFSGSSDLTFEKSNQSFNPRAHDKKNNKNTKRRTFGISRAGKHRGGVPPSILFVNRSPYVWLCSYFRESGHLTPVEFPCVWEHCRISSRVMSSMLSVPIFSICAQGKSHLSESQIGAKIFSSIIFLVFY